MNSVLHGTSDSTLKTFWTKSKNIFECIFLKKIKEKNFAHTVGKKLK